MILYIDVYKIIREDGMGVIIKELPHPYKLTHKNYKQKWMRLFLWWVS